MHSNPEPPQRQIARWIVIAVAVLVLFTIVLLVAIWPKPQAPAASPAQSGGSQTSASTLARGQQNTQRKNDAAAVASSVTEYQANNTGSLPTSTGGTDTELLLCDSDCTQSSKVKLGVYKAQHVMFQGWYALLKVPDANTMYLVTGGMCSTDETALSPKVAPSNRELAILYALDAGDGNIEQHCQDLSNSQ